MYYTLHALASPPGRGRSVTRSARLESPLRVAPWWGDRCRSTTATGRSDTGGRGSRVRPAPADDRGRPSGGDDATGVRTNLGVSHRGTRLDFTSGGPAGRAGTATLRGSGSAGISPSTWPPGSAPGVSSDNGPMTDVGRATPCSAPSGPGRVRHDRQARDSTQLEAVLDPARFAPSAGSHHLHHVVATTDPPTLRVLRMVSPA